MLLQTVIEVTVY